MTRYRQIYNIWGLYASDAPATGYHYSYYDGTKHNNPQLTIFDNNLISQIDRVNSVEYGFDISRTNFTQLGVRGLIDRPITERPSVQLNFNYYSVGVRNEHRLGLIVNYLDITGSPVYDQEFCCFKNFTGQETDYRNLFVAVTPDNNDLNNRIGDPFTTGTSLNPSGLFVFGFGNCYINAYSVRAAVSDLPQVSVGYICDNIMGYPSGSGANIPAVFPKSGNLVSGVTFVIPRNTTAYSPSVLKPGDITLQINDIDRNFSTDATWGILSSGLPIQAFDLSVDLNREDLRGIGYILPVDRRINFPIFANLNISSIIDNNYSGSLINVLNQNKSYDILVNMYNPSCELTGRNIGIQYKLKNTKFDGVTYNYAIGPNLVGNFKFSAEIDIDNPNKGLFISGLWNAPIPEFPFTYLVLEENWSGFLYSESNNLFIVAENPL